MIKTVNRKMTTSGYQWDYEVNGQKYTIRQRHFFVCNDRIEVTKYALIKNGKLVDYYDRHCDAYMFMKTHERIRSLLNYCEQALRKAL